MQGCSGRSGAPEVAQESELAAREVSLNGLATCADSGALPIRSLGTHLVDERSSCRSADLTMSASFGGVNTSTLAARFATLWHRQVGAKTTVGTVAVPRCEEPPERLQCRRWRCKRSTRPPARPSTDGSSTRSASWWLVACCPRAGGCLGVWYPHFA